jgi:hypothetical protein
VGVSFLLLFLCQTTAGEIELRPLADPKAALPNPHKGWYHHFPDNHIGKYAIARDSDLLDFPGMDHLYLRLAWAYLEPREGQFNWKVVDELIDKWTSHRLGIAFRISCKETSTDRIEQQFATPKWVMEAGARGGYFRMGKPAGPDAPWEPDFADPIFLSKLDSFLEKFAERYDGRPWLRYVDIGSIGDWGEGHTWAGSRKDYGYEERKLHVDMYLKHFKKSQLVISDDFVYACGGPEERKRMHRYVLEHRIAYRDDSILVDGYFSGHSATSTVRSPEFFADSYLKTPNVLELEHYGTVKKSGNWTPAPGSSLGKFGGGRTGAEMLRTAVDLLHATYIGYHGYADEWLKDNPDLTIELLNRCGYWYFLDLAKFTNSVRLRDPLSLELTWRNRGVAPAYAPFQLQVRLEGTSRIDLSTDSGNTRWLPEAMNASNREAYVFQLPASGKPGSYLLKARLFCPASKRNVLIAVRPALLDSEGYLPIGKIELQ